MRVGAAEDGLRLDTFLARRLGVGRRTAARLATHARVNGRPAAKGRLLASGDSVSVTLPAVPADPARTPPTLVAVEGSVVILAKPPGLATVTIAGRLVPSVARWLAAQRPECAPIGRPGEAGLVHRLDTGTSGILLAARNASAYATLRNDFRHHRIEKSYLAVVWGAIEAARTIDAPIGQHRKSRTGVRALPAGPHPRYAVTPAETRVVPIAPIGPATLVEATTRTGARHQIRAHLAHIGHPLVADARYGGDRTPGLGAFLLHATQLRWRDPDTGQALCHRCDPPRGWSQALAVLRGPADGTVRRN